MLEEYFILAFLKKFVVQKVKLLVLLEKNKLGFRMVISCEKVLNMKLVRRNFGDYQTHYPPPKLRVEL